jgi:hypothetical protein
MSSNGIQGAQREVFTIGQTIEELHRSLRDYIEATYHISHPELVKQRRELLDREGIISQRAFVESTPKYRKGAKYADIEGLDPAIASAFAVVSQEDSRFDPALPRLIFDPPYDHQREAVERSLVDSHDLVVMTGTGSGKTESFLLPILGKLALEAAHKPQVFKGQSAMRALVLYPMNALVNDQLGRMRLLFADPRLVTWFREKAGRPIRFARYTSRTLYPGVRTAKKDTVRLKPISDYYVSKIGRTEDADLIKELKVRGKWPAKPDLAKWYGDKNSRWTNAEGEFLRCITLPSDSELVTRHEVQRATPDVLITNYSMLEYMLMRPLERPVFDQTREWLTKNPHERFLIVLDEAHLYRGAGGTEVALLIRRFRTRLGIPPERLQVICTSASFSNPDSARTFGAQLTGKQAKPFKAIRGTLDERSPATPAFASDANLLANFDLEAYFAADDEPSRIEVCRDLIHARGVRVVGGESLGKLLFDALAGFGPLNLLINHTMKRALTLRELQALVFPGVEERVASRAATVLMTLASAARPSASEPGLLPCRIHAFFRGLPGLWICLDSNCSELPLDQRGGPAGKLFAQPRERCGCGAVVLELFTCRDCGSAYARGYTNDLESPTFLWPEAGEKYRDEGGTVTELFKLDLLLEQPRVDVESADFDLVTARLNANPGPRTRTVYLRKDRTQPPAGDDEEPATAEDADLGEFRPCGVCQSPAKFRSSVQDHQTKGDQPFQALVSKQLQVQPPGARQATQLAPHRGRKVLVFSDSRQMAARLAPNIQNYSLQDVLRPLMVVGFDRLWAIEDLRPSLSLDELYLAVLIAAKGLGVRLRPELGDAESFDAERIVDDQVNAGALTQPVKAMRLLLDVARSRPPSAILKGMAKILTDPYYGLESLALASLAERLEHQEVVSALADIPGVAQTREQKLALVRMWLGRWAREGIWLNGMPEHWLRSEVGLHSGVFRSINSFIAAHAPKTSQALFKNVWLPTLLNIFAERMGGTNAKPKFRLKGSSIRLETSGPWEYCSICRSVQRPYPDVPKCIRCHSPEIRLIDPNTDPVFAARKGYYRASTLEAFKGITPMALIAAEHTAQIGAAQANEIYSRAEEHELLFQDVALGPDDRGRQRSAIDVLSCTTTMEVGIDIGALSGVALRNMPPGRANYQQRAGRAGRRGNAIATVIALASADSHDEHYFSQPDDLVRGDVRDPRLTLNNYDITRRHVTAYLLQRYHGERLPSIAPEEQPQLFEVLGTVAEFRNAQSTLNRNDFAAWLNTSSESLKREIRAWIPEELGRENLARLLSGIETETIALVDRALGEDGGASIGEPSNSEG